MRGGWNTALDAQNDLRHSLQTGEGQRYLWNFAESLRKTPLYDARGDIIVGAGNAAEYIIKMAIDTVETGDPLYVSEEVVDLVEYAAASLEPERLMPEDILIANGFAYFERALYLHDRHGRVLSYRAMSWAQTKRDNNPDERGVAISLWADARDEGDYSSELRSRVGMIGGSRLILQHVTNIPYGNVAVLEREGNHEFVRQLQAFWKLMKQEIVLPSQQQVDRPTWRSKNNWRQIKHVTVLTLRRARYQRPDGQPSKIEWSHRWPVHGHWRNQPYKDKKTGNRFYSQIWINPYIKGPDDKPFVAKQRAFEFTR